MAVAAAEGTGAVKKTGGRGLSFEEKRKRLNEYLLEKKDFFQLKDLEKHVPKATGIIVQSVKEVLQSLVDDRLVQGEKIGISNYYWSFPSTAMKTRTSVISGLEGEISRLSEARKRFESQIEECQAARQDTNERQEMLDKYQQLEQRHAELAGKLELHRANDPKLLEAKRVAAKEAQTAANRWTDNVFTLQSYCASTFNIDRGTFNEQFGIPEELDYVG